jgi:hypothetical protein
MWRFVTLFAFIMLFGVSTGLYHVKYSVDRMERQGLGLKVKIAEEKSAIRILEAEWSSLNRPDRLQKLSQRHLDLAPVQVSQVVSFAAIPEKPSAPEEGNGALVARTPQAAPPKSTGQTFAATPAVTMLETR